MKIPENFKQKYALKGDSYPSANADAALSELFSVSGRLYKENADLKAEVAALREASENAPAQIAEIDLSGLEHTVSGLEMMIHALEIKLDAVKTAINDTLCVVNDAAISAKKAEESAAEAKNASEYAADSAKAALLEVIKLGEDIKSQPVTIPAVYPEGLVGDSEPEANEEDDGILELLITDTPTELIEETLPTAEEEQIPEERDIISESEEVPVAEPEENIAAAEEESEELQEAESDAAEDEPDTAAEDVEEDIEIIPESEEEPVAEENENIADYLIRSAGLDSEPEEIEPAQPVSEDDLSAKLSKMYAEQEDEEPLLEEKKEEPEPAPEKPAPKSFTDMKSALDAIRARLKK